MKKPTVRIVIADEAKADLKNIYYRIIEKTKSVQNAKNVRADIIQASKDIHFVKQYQVDEFLGEPFRRMVVRHYKIIYKPINDKEIRILQIFDTSQSPDKMSV